MIISVLFNQFEFHVVSIMFIISPINNKFAVINLTKRQLLCFGSGALIGVPLFFVLKTPLGTSTAALIMVITMLPFFLLAMFERNGQPLEKVVKNMANVLFLRPKQRPYRTKNYYACLMRLEKEVSLDKNQKK